MSISLAFSGGKPCCNKKATNNAVACKFNQASIGADKYIAGELLAETTDGDRKSYKCNIGTGNQCANSVKKSWWKFWVKKSSKTCPCMKAEQLQIKDNSNI